MICTVIAMLLTLGTEIFASHAGNIPSSKRNGMMDKIRDKVEQGVRDIEDGLTPGTTDNGNVTDMPNKDDSTSSLPNAENSTGSAEPATSTTPSETSPSTTKTETTTVAEDSTESSDSKGFNWLGVLIAVAIAAAVVILIIALLPKK